uniref:Transposase n=1 Tax=Ascaris lumbricoides TaxID=6252 RepID=A0A0M3IXQ2_ASCLU
MKSDWNVVMDFFRKRENISSNDPAKYSNQSMIFLQRGIFIDRVIFVVNDSFKNLISGKLKGISKKKCA